MDATYGWALNAEGFCVNIEDEAAYLASPVSFGYEYDYTDGDGTTHPIAVFTYSPLGVLPAEGQVINTKFAIEYDAKIYEFKIRIMNEETFTGIEQIESSKVSNGNVYDMTGRLVRKNTTSVNGLANGIYILNGKKYIVK
jgi:hypothetical protein